MRTKENYAFQATRVKTMAIPVVEFSREGYNSRYVIAEFFMISTSLFEMVEIPRHTGYLIAKMNK